MANLIVGIFAVSLCLINEAIWTYFSGLPLMGATWMLAAAMCIKLQKWSSF